MEQLPFNSRCPQGLLRSQLSEYLMITWKAEEAEEREEQVPSATRPCRSPNHAPPEPKFPRGGSGWGLASPLRAEMLGPDARKKKKLWQGGILCRQGCGDARRAVRTRSRRARGVRAAPPCRYTRSHTRVQTPTCVHTHGRAPLWVAAPRRAPGAARWGRIPMAAKDKPARSSAPSPARFPSSIFGVAALILSDSGHLTR